MRTISQSGILGPFWCDGAPGVPINRDIVYQHFPNEQTAYFSGHGPLVGVDLAMDVWHTGPDGLYDAQIVDSPYFNMRGRISTDKDDFYGFYCLKPVSYPIPHDGPGKDLQKVFGCHPMRQAHTQLMVNKTGSKPLITQIYDRDGQYLTDEAVFAVKDSPLVSSKSQIKQER